MTYLSIRSVTKHYSGHTALNEVSFDIPAQSIFGLLGPNGAGKTSLIRIINQITAADSGEIFIDDRPLKPSDVERIGYLPEERGLYSKMKVLDQIIFFARLKGRSASDARKIAVEWLEKFDLMDWRNKKAEELSKGMQQKIQFIITVLHSPELIILDEPFTGFDPINTEVIKQEISRLRDNGATVIFSTHRMESVEEICDHIGMINRSRKVLEGSVREIRKKASKGDFRLEFKATEVPSSFSIQDVVKTADDTFTGIMNITDDERRSVIARINDSVDLIAIQEVIPSMHQIFIDKVKETEL